MRKRALRDDLVQAFHFTSESTKIQGSYITREFHTIAIKIEARMNPVC